MKRFIVILTAVLLFSSGTISAFAFSDVDTSDEILYESVTDLNRLGVIAGYEDGTFRPNNNVTRAEFANIIKGLIPQTTNSGITIIRKQGSEIYCDVETGYWADYAIGLVSELGYLNGYEDGSFKGDNSITYQEAAKIFTCMLHYDSISEENGGYPAGYIATAADIGLFENIPLLKESSMTRRDVAVMTENAVDIQHRHIISYSMKNGAVYKVSNMTYRNMLGDSME